MFTYKKRDKGTVPRICKYIYIYIFGRLKKYVPTCVEDLCKQTGKSVARLMRGRLREIIL